MKDKKNLLIAALVFAIVVMAVGYAAFSTTLTINGKATVEAAWDVEITGITRSGQSDAAAVEDTTSPTFTTTTANFDVKLKAPGAWAEYTVTVANKGTINAVLDTSAVVASGTTLVTGTASDIAGTPNENIIKYSITTAPAASLPAPAVGSTADTTTLVIRVEWDPTVAYTAPTAPDAVDEEITLAVVYKQAS